MNILIAVHDLTIEKWHLMPWRTVVEVVNGLQSYGHTAILISLDKEHSQKDFSAVQELPKGTCSISKNRQNLFQQLTEVVEKYEADVLFWPVTWREPRWRTKIVANQKTKVIGWFPGGVYRVSDTIYALRKMGLKNTLPYLIEALYPKRMQMRYMKKTGIDGLLSMTSFTKKEAVECGWPSKSVFTIPPGKDYIKESAVDIEHDIAQWLDGRPFLLFMGPPSSIRGVNEVLSAFELVSKETVDMRLICLFRSDGYLERDEITDYIDTLVCKQNIYTIWDSLKKSQLNGYIKACHAAVMPFILVPSEIPLAIIEVTAYGKPVLGTTCGGTGEFVAAFGVSTPIGDVNALAQSMLKIMNKDFYSQCCEASQKTYAGHPDWDDVARHWGDIAEKVL